MLLLAFKEKNIGHIYCQQIDKRKYWCTETSHSIPFETLILKLFQMAEAPFLASVEATLGDDDDDDVDKILLAMMMMR